MTNENIDAMREAADELAREAQNSENKGQRMTILRTDCASLTSEYVAHLAARSAENKESEVAREIGTVDTSEFRELLSTLQGHSVGKKVAALITHINQHTAQAVKAAREAQQWISLKIAKPADFQPVLVALNTGTVVVGMRASMGWHWDETDDLADADATATHWMPLPAAPQPAEGQEKP